jgi:hypothetical protein
MKLNNMTDLKLRDFTVHKELLNGSIMYNGLENVICFAARNIGNDQVVANSAKFSRTRTEFVLL